MLRVDREMLLVAMLVGRAGAASQAASVDASLCPSRTLLTSDCASVCPDHAFCTRFRASYSATVDRSSFSDTFNVDANGCVFRCTVSVIEAELRRIKVNVSGYGVDTSEDQRDGSKVEAIAALRLPGNVTGLEIAADGDEPLLFGYPDGNIVADGTKLEFLGFDGIMLWNLPKAVYQLPITTVQLKSDGSSFPSAVADFRNISTLILDGSSLTEFPTLEVLRDMPQVRSLSLTGNGITDVTTNATTSDVVSQSALQVLRLDENQLTAFTLALPELEVLELHGNQLTKLPGSLEKMPKLRQLRLDRNSLDSNELADQLSALEPLPTMQQLNLTDCDLEDHALSELATVFSNLTELDLARNHLTQVQDEDLPIQSLRNLNLSANNLTVFNASFNRLHTLDLSRNKLTTFPSTAVWGATALSVLRLDGNADMAPINVTAQQFQTLESLVDFTIDASVLRGVNCPSAWIQLAHGVSICVVPAASSNNSTDSTVVTMNAASTSRQGAIITTIVLIVAAVLFGIGACWHSRRRQQKAIDSHTQPAQAETNRHARAKSLSGRRRGDSRRARDVDPLVNIWNDSLLLKLRVEMETVRFVKVIGTGSYGQVWRGMCRAPMIPNSHVAIKTLSSEMARDRRVVKRFVAEIKLQATLLHPRIVEVMGVAWTSLSDLCVLMEFMPRGDLFSALHYSAASSDSSSSSMFQLGVWGESKLQITLDIVDALAFAHALSPAVIHRDLKSTNVLLDLHGRAKVADFSVSRVSSIKNTALARNTSPWWIAPEVVLGKADYDEKVDVYAFGVILSELDTHEAPYSAEVIDMTVALLRSVDVRLPDQGPRNQPSGRDKTNRIKEAARRQVLHQIAIGGVRPQFSSSCPRVIHDIAQRCLATDPSVRPSAMDLYHLLRRVEMDGNDARVSVLV